MLTRQRQSVLAGIYRDDSIVLVFKKCCQQIPNGRIVANNSSGMCCGTALNSYHTLESMKLLLADGTLVDTSAPDADDVLRRENASLHAEIARLRDELRAQPALSQRIRRKFSRKNTMGYSLNALLDYERPADILAHLMIGSQGTLGFIAEATLRCVPEPPARATALVCFEELTEAGAAVAPLAQAGAAVLEIMDVSNERRELYRNDPTIVFEFVGRKDAKTHGMAEDASNQGVVSIVAKKRAFEPWY